jgi:aryl-alcohol dehydrogenase-like predicted oxidoreductase
LAALAGIAKKHRASVATVAIRYVLQQRGVGAAIVGVRHTRHLPDTLRLFNFALDEEDLGTIQQATRQAQGPVGDIYSVERVKGGSHASIMKYNLGRV